MAGEAFGEDMTESVLREAFDPGEKRDDGGKWTAGGGSAPAPDDRAARKEARKERRKQARSDYHAIAGDVFGDRAAHDGDYVEVEDAGRKLSMEFRPETHSVFIEFTQSTRDVADPSAKQSGQSGWDTTAKDLQAGTVGFAHKLTDFIRRVGKAGVNVSYETTEPRRRRLYAKMLSAAGFEEAASDDVEESLWKPRRVTESAAVAHVRRSATLLEAVVLLEAWDSLKHPRGKGGRFIPKGSAEAVSAAHEQVKASLKGTKTATSAKELADHLSILTVKQLHELKKAHNLSASGKTVDELREKIAARLDVGRRGEMAEPAGHDASLPTDADFVKGEAAKRKAKEEEPKARAEPESTEDITLTDRQKQLASVYRARYPSISQGEADGLAASVPDDDYEAAPRAAIQKALDLHHERTNHPPELSPLAATNKRKRLRLSEKRLSKACLKKSRPMSRSWGQREPTEA